ncbi:MAG: DNA polymerase III subunit alpha [Deltaproteobacteria bacterium]
MAGGGFIHLHLHSQYSLLDGAIKFDELFRRAREFGMPAVALTDHGNLFGAHEFYKEGRRAGIKPIIGCEVYVAPAARRDKSQEEKNHHLTVLSANAAGYRNLSRLVTRAYFEGFYRRPRVDMELLDTHREGLIILSGCMNSELSKRVLANDMKGALEVAARYRELFGDRYYLEIQANGISEQDALNQKLLELGRKLSIPVVATNDCHYLRREDAKSHDVLLCVQTGVALKDENRMRFTGDEFFMKSRAEMVESLRGCEGEIERTMEIAERCSFDLKTAGYKMPVFKLEGGKSLEERMAELARENLEYRIEENKIDATGATSYRARLEGEIDTIAKMGFAGYFLVVSDFINYAKSRRIPVGPGRGSAAGSLVAYALGITEIDPIPYNLIFERFLNPERVSMPDIDVDFCGERRDEVIKYVTEKYGSDRVAQIGTFGTMSAKAVIKDVGRVMGVPYADVDRITKLIPTFRGKVFSLDEAIEKVPQLQDLLQKHSHLRELVENARPLEDMVRHSSTHAAGIVISDEPLADFIPLYRGSKDETVTQFDMKSIEDLGYVKFDFLGLKTLTVIDKAVEFIRASSTGFDVMKIPLDDERVYKFLSSGKTRGVFQIESSGMKEVLTKLEPSNFEEIIALLALYRPGPLDSGMVDEFIKRKHGQKRIDYPLPELQEILKDTYGLFVYQEQIMKTSSVLADYSLGEADLLRRAMGKKKPEEMKAQRERFLDGARRKGINSKKAEEIFDAMENFAEYSFNKSHSAAYALLTYQTAYLKTHFPAEFMAALLSSEAGNSDKVISSIAECREMGIEVLAPDVNESASGFTALEGKIRFGLAAVKNLGEATVDAVIKARQGGGAFKSVFDFLERVDTKKVNRKTLESLIKGGAFDSLGSHRAELSDSIDTLLSYSAGAQKGSPEGQISLFGALSASISQPKLKHSQEWGETEVLKGELDTLGFYVSSHPMAKYSAEIKRYADTDTQMLQDAPDRRDIAIAGVVRSLTVKHTKNGAGIFGNLILEDMKGSAEVIVFNDLLRKSMPLLEEKSEPVIVRGTIENSEDRVKIRAAEIYSIREMRSGSAAHIMLKKELATPENLLKLKRIADAYPGESRVFLHIADGEEEVLVESGNCHVEIQDKFIDDIERVIGRGGLRVG